MTLLNGKTARRIRDSAGRLDCNELRLAGKLQVRRLSESIFRLDCDEENPDGGSHEDFIRPCRQR